MIQTLFLCEFTVNAGASHLNYIKHSNEERQQKIFGLVKWVSILFAFNQDIEHVAVCYGIALDTGIASGSLAKHLGRTPMIVWYDNTSAKIFLFSIIEDYSASKNIIKGIHTNCKIAIVSSRQDLQPGLILNDELTHSILQMLSQKLKGFGNISSGLPSQLNNQVAVIDLIKISGFAKPKKVKINFNNSFLGEGNILAQRLSAVIIVNNTDILMLSDKIKNQLIRFPNSTDSLLKMSSASLTIL
ncbi:hypothetical protein [Pseudoalteromonas sp.]|uniref:hypothetical protein n=1 Tax=Pseudoalteromonas sp. TaxID=53249 RepID=UPI001BCAD3A0|nr:hypothetical protein [Pseudoalteromonas sp.]